MKRNAIFGAIAVLVIAGLMISTSGLAAVQQSATPIKSTDVSSKTLDKATIISRINDPNFLQSLVKINAEPKIKFAAKTSTLSTQKQSLSAMSETVQSAVLPVKTGSRIDYPEDSFATEPALSSDANSNLVLGFKYNYVNYSHHADDLNIVLWQGSTDGGDSWSDGLYFINRTGSVPIPFSYPSVHYRGLVNGTLPTYSGTAVAPHNLQNEAPYYKGGITPVLEVQGDVTVNNSYSLSYWDWHTYGWHDAKMGENAAALIQDPTYWFAWGFNSWVISTTYTNPAIVDGCFINYQTDATGMGTISWYSDLNGALSTDAVMDNNAMIYVPNYSQRVDTAPDNIVHYAGYAVYDPMNETSENHYPAIRQLDLLATVYDYANNDNWDSLYYWTFESPTISSTHPSVEAYNSNVICAWELTDTTAPEDTELQIWQTPTGNISDFETVAGWYIPTGGRITSPDLIHIEGDRFALVAFVEEPGEDAVLVFGLSDDGGRTWDGLYSLNTGSDIIATGYRNVEFADKGEFIIWPYDASTEIDAIISLHYSPLTAHYTGYVCKVTYPGIAVPGAEVLAYNLHPVYGKYVGSVYTNDEGIFDMLLVPGFDVWVNETSPITMRFIALDGTNYIKINEYQITDIQEVNDLSYFLLNIHYRDLKTFPWYSPDSYRMNGATVAQMMLNYLTWNSSRYARPPMTFPDQTALYDDFRGTNLYINATQMAGGLNSKIRPLDPYYAYFFAAYGNTLAADTLKSICVWIDYPVDYYNDAREHDVPIAGYPNHVPVAVPVVNGTYAHWVAVRGIHTDQPCWPPGSIVNLNVYGLWINDPVELGNGLGRTYVPIATWNSVYFKPITVVGDDFQNKYVAVTDPFVGQTEVSDDFSIVCQPSPVASVYSPAIVKAGENAKSLSMVKTAALKNIEQSARELVNRVLTNDADQILVSDFADTTMKSAIKQNGQYVVFFEGDVDFIVTMQNGVLVKFTYA